MIRRNRRRGATIALTMSILMGAESLLPPVALAQQTGTPTTASAAHVTAAGARDATGEVPLVAAADPEVRDTGHSFSIGKNTDTQPNKSGIANLPLINKIANFEFVEQTIPIRTWKDDDGASIIAVNVDSKNKALWKDILGNKTTVWDNALKNFKTANEKGSGGFKFKPIFQMEALAKLKDTSGSGNAAFLVGMKGAVEGQYVVFTGEFSVTGLIGAKVPFSYDTTKGASVSLVQVVGSFSPKLAGGVGCAYIGRFGVYGTGALNAEATVLPKNDAGWNKVALTANIGLEVVALGFRVWHKDLWKGGPWDLITPRAIRAASEGYDIRPLFAVANEDVLIVPIQAMATTSAWYGTTFEYDDAPYIADGQDKPQGAGNTFADNDMTANSSTPQQGLRLLKRNVYPDAQVQVTDVPGGAVMSWLESDATDTNKMNATRLMWSRYDAASDLWSEPQPVNTGDDAETADFEPDLFADAEGNVHAVWLSASSDVPQNAANIDTVTRLLEVRYARLPKGATAFDPSVVIAGSEAEQGPQGETAERIDGYFRTTPQVAASGETIRVGWSTTPVENILDYDGSHQVIVKTGVRHPDGDYDWYPSDVKTLGKQYEVTSLDAGMLNELPCVAYTYNDLTMASDGSVSTSASPSQLVLVTNEAHTGITHADNVDFAHRGNAGVLTWSETKENGNYTIKVLDDVAGTPATQLDDVELPPNYQIDGDLSSSALISYQQWESGDSDEESSTDIYGRVLTNGRDLSDESLLVAHADDLTSHDVAYVGGKPLVALAAERGVGDESAAAVRSADLFVAKGDSLERLAIADLLYDEDDVWPGAKVPATVIVRNEGLVPIEGGVYAQIIDDSTGGLKAQAEGDAAGTLIGEGTISTPIAIDGEAEIPVTITVPTDFDPTTFRDISVKTNFAGQQQAKDSSALNLDTILLGPDYEDDASDGGQDAGGNSNTGGRDLIPNSGQRGTYTHRDDTYYSSSDTTTVVVPTTTTSSKVTRTSGADRYDTMRSTVLGAFGASDWAILASGEGFADALSALSLAGAHQAPVVLTARDHLSPQAKEVLERLGCTHVIVAGGEAAVSEAALLEASAICGDVRRVAGADRYQTSQALMREALAAGSASDTVLVATGTTFADALSAGPLSWRQAAPVVLAGADQKLSDEAVAAIKANARISRIVLLGGDAVVSDAVRDQLGSSYEYVRLGGADRYQTSGAVARWATTRGLGWTRPYVATGTNFADALAGAAAAGMASSCLLLADNATAPTLDALAGHSSEVRAVTILGGERAVSPEVADALAKTVG